MQVCHNCIIVDLSCRSPAAFVVTSNAVVVGLCVSVGARQKSFFASFTDMVRDNEHMNDDNGMQKRMNDMYADMWIRKNGGIPT